MKIRLDAPDTGIMLDLVTNNQTQECHRRLPEKDGKENPGRLHQRQNLSTPNSKNGQYLITSFTIQMEMGRTCRKALPQRMGAGNNYVGPLQRQEKQREAKHQMGRLFQQTSGTSLVQSGEK